MRFPTPRFLFAILVGAPLLAQGLDGGDLVLVDYGGQSLLRISDAGGVSTLFQGAPLQGPTGVAIGADLDVFVSDFTTDTVYRLARGGGLTPFATGVVDAIRLAADRDGSLLAPSLTTAALLRIDPAGNVTTVAQGPPLVRPYDVVVDADGSYLVCDEGRINQAGTQALYRVSRGGAVTPIWQGAPFQLPHGVAVLADGDYAVIDGRVDAVFRLPRAGGPPTVVVQVPAIRNPESLCADFEGRLVLAQETAANRSIDRIDGAGTVVPIVASVPSSNIEGIARAPRLAGPALAPRGQTTTLALRMGAAQAGRVYAVWATLSVYPGVPLGDGRGIAGNPDALFTLSLGAHNSAFVQWSGVLSPAGEAAPALAVPRFPGPPVPFHLQAASLDPAGPSLVALLANPRRVDV